MRAGTKTSPPIHLRVHSQYTLLESTASVEALAQRAKADGMSHLALTDTHALYGAVAFDRACRQAGVRPIIGMTTIIALPAAVECPDDRRGGGKPLILLASTTRGYRSLCALSSEIQGHPDREERMRTGLSLDTLTRHSEGLVCLTGGLEGWTAHLLRAGRGEAAQAYIDRLIAIYRDGLYLGLEIQRAMDLTLAYQISEMAKTVNRKTVVVHPIYAIDREAASQLQLLEAIRRNCPVEERAKNQDITAPGEPEARHQRYWLGPQAMGTQYRAFPDALQTTHEVAARCGDVLPDGTPIWPKLDLSRGEDGPRNRTPEDLLSVMAHQGLRDRYGPIPHPEIRDRLKRELNAIARYGYTPLFLVVADIVRFAREQEIPVSTRGSVANALVAYCTGITTVDPVQHGLLFERFLSPARTDPPDIDLDLCSRRRDEVLAYVRERYGDDQVALVATLSTLQPRSAVRSVAKAYGLRDEKLEALLAGLPRHWHPNPSQGPDEAMQELIRQTTDADMAKVLRAAYPLIGQIDHLSVHPGGIVITPGPLTDVLPVQWAPKGYLITQFDHHDVEALGLPKIDLLGIRALTVLADAAEQIRTHYDPAFKLGDTPLNDPPTEETLSSGETVGVFQCESEGARRTLRKLNAQTVRDLAIANAFFKPGPATGGMADTFIRRYRGEAEVSYLHPSLEPILGPTKGVLIFQEQILRVATEVAGLSWQQAGHLRRGMSKMKPEEMVRMREEFLAGCMRKPPNGPGMTDRQGQELWRQVEAFSGYGFNQGHATAYADVSYRSAFIKTHWPAAFFCARLQTWGGFHHPAVYMAEAIRLGIDVRPPHINASTAHFNLDWEGDQAVLWMGLNQVRDLRHRAMTDIVHARQRGRFSSPRDLLSRVPLHIKEVTHLIQCGALEGLGPNRPTMLALAHEIRQAGNAYQRSFEFLDHQRPRAELSQHLAWEKRVLGYPIAALRAYLPALVEQHPDATRLHPRKWQPGQSAHTFAVRLPGRTGGGGFYLWDGATWVIAKVRASQKNPSPWRILEVQGRWHRDRWGMDWMQVHHLRTVPLRSSAQV